MMISTGPPAKNTTSSNERVSFGKPRWNELAVHAEMQLYYHLSCQRILSCHYSL